MAKKDWKERFKDVAGSKQEKVAEGKKHTPKGKPVKELTEKDLKKILKLDTEE